jgi:hypothetical protein
MSGDGLDLKLEELLKCVLGTEDWVDIWGDLTYEEACVEATKLLQLPSGQLGLKSCREEYFSKRILEVGDEVKFKGPNEDWIFGKITYHETDNAELYTVDLKHSTIHIAGDYLRLVRKGNDEQDNSRG